MIAMLALLNPRASLTLEAFADLLAYLETPRAKP